MYLVLLEVTEGDQDALAQHSWRGAVTISAAPEAPVLRFVRTAASVFWREFGF